MKHYYYYVIYFPRWSNSQCPSALGLVRFIGIEGLEQFLAGLVHKFV